MSVTLTPGLRSSVRIAVANADTAAAVGSGDLPVLATPRLLALAEAAAVAAIRPALHIGQTTVGTSAVLEHTRPSPVGAEVEVAAELTAIDGRRLTFTFTGWHERSSGSAGPGQALIGSGTMQRVIVDAEQFLDRAQAG